MKTVSKRIWKCLRLGLFLVSGAALAGPYGGFYQTRETNRQNGWQRPEPPGYARDGNRQGFPRNDRADAPRPQRLSPEERRQLRRDIKDAGRTIYPPRR